MASMLKLDLRGVILPVALLNCCRSLWQLDKGAPMEVLISDSEAVHMLVKIIERSHDRDVRAVSIKDHFRIHIGPERRSDMKERNPDSL